MMHYMCYRQLNSTQTMHVAQEAYILQPYFAQAHCPLVNSLICNMKCNQCKMNATFRARNATTGGIFAWWCQSCFKFHQLSNHDVVFDVDFPIMCHKCKDQPASLRAKTKQLPVWLYWCYSCHERQSDPGPSDDMIVFDLDSASEAASEDDVDDEHADDGHADDGHVELDDNHEDADDVHADDGTHSCSSFNSWHLPLACNLQSLELQSHADTMSIASSSSFQMVFGVCDNDETASISSFQMVPTTAPVVADPDQEQQQQEQPQPEQLPDPEQQQQDAHEFDQICGKQFEEFEQELDLESNVADVGSDVGSMVDIIGLKDPDDDPDDLFAKWQEDQNFASGLAKWQEEQELRIAIEVSMHEEQLQITEQQQRQQQLQTAAKAAAATAAAKAAVADNSDSKCSSSNSSSSNSMPTLAATLFTQKLPKRTQKKPRWPLSDFQIKPSRLPSAFTVHKTGLEAIPEVHVDEAMHVSEYVDSSGCSQSVFTGECIKTSAPVPMCPKHLLDYQPHCRECANHQFLMQKHHHDLQLAAAIESSFDSSSIIWVDALPWCSTHYDNMMQCCHTCQQVFELRGSSSIIWVDALPWCSTHYDNMMQCCHICQQVFELRGQGLA